MAHLKAWYRTLNDVVWQDPGVFWTDLDETENRIEIEMGVRRGGREEMQAAIAAVNVLRGPLRSKLDAMASGSGPSANNSLWMRPSSGPLTTRLRSWTRLSTGRRCG